MEALNKIKSYFSDISQYLIIFTAIVYGLGFLVINGYLSSFNLLSLDILKARYFLAGILVIFGLLICTYLAWIFIKKLKQIKNKYDNEKNSSFWATLQDGLTAVLGLNAGITALGSASEVLFNTGNKPLIVYSQKFHNADIVGKIISTQLPLASDSAKFFIWFGTYMSIILFALFVIFTLYMLFIHSKFNKKPNIVKNTEVVNQNSNLSKPVQIIIGAVILLEASILFSFCIASFGYASTQLALQSVNAQNISNQLTLFGVYTSWITFVVYTMIFIFFLLQGWKITSFEKLIKDLLNNPQTYLSFVLADILLSIILFGRAVYPKIPTELGGGQPRKVYITFDKSYNQNQPKNATFYLIDTTQSTYLFIEDINKKRFPIEIRKDTIDSIQTEE